VGTIEGHDWIVTEEVRGQNLHDAWPTLTSEERGRAIASCGRVCGFCTTPRPRSVCSSDRTRASYRHPLTNDQGRGPIASVLRWVCRMGSGRGSTRSSATTTEPRPSFEPVVKPRGSLALMNALWDGEVVALLDFEFAVLARWRSTCAGWCARPSCPRMGRGPTMTPAWPAFAIAARERDPVHGRALLLGAAVLDQLRDLEIWLRPRPDRGRVRRLAPGPAAHQLARDRRRLPRTRADVSRRSSVGLGDHEQWVRRTRYRRRDANNASATASCRNYNSRCDRDPSTLRKARTVAGDTAWLDALPDLVARWQRAGRSRSGARSTASG